MMLKKCKECNKDFEVNSKTKRKQFCNLSCSTIYNNKKRGSLSKEHKITISSSLKTKWIQSPDLFSKGQDHAKTVGKYTKGRYKQDQFSSINQLSPRTVQKIIKRIGLSCSNCGWDKTTCDIHHINGRKIEDCHNHNNLSLLCPNCHRLVHEGKLNPTHLKTLAEILPTNWIDFYYG